MRVNIQACFPYVSTVLVVVLIICVSTLVLILPFPHYHQSPPPSQHQVINVFLSFLLLQIYADKKPNGFCYLGEVDSIGFRNWDVFLNNLNTKVDKEINKSESLPNYGRQY